MIQPVRLRRSGNCCATLSRRRIERAEYLDHHEDQPDRLRRSDLLVLGFPMLAAVRRITWWRGI
jgi:hypothetical protein